MTVEGFDNWITILRTSEPVDLARATDALDTAGIPYRIESGNEGSMRLPRRVYAVLVDAWHEEAAFALVEGIPAEFEIPEPTGESPQLPSRKPAIRQYVLLGVLILIPIVLALWRRFA